MFTNAFKRYNRRKRREVVIMQKIKNMVFIFIGIFLTILVIILFLPLMLLRLGFYLASQKKAFFAK